MSKNPDGDGDLPPSYNEATTSYHSSSSLNHNSSVSVTLNNLSFLLRETQAQQTARDTVTTTTLLPLLTPHITSLLTRLGTTPHPPISTELYLVPAAAVGPEWIIASDADPKAGQVAEVIRVEPEPDPDSKGRGGTKGQSTGAASGNAVVGSPYEFDEWGRWDDDVNTGASTSREGEWWWSDEGLARRLAKRLQPEPKLDRTVVRAVVEEAKEDKKAGRWGLFRAGTDPSSSPSSSSSGPPPSRQFMKPTSPSTTFEENVTMTVRGEEVTFRRENEMGIWESMRGFGIVGLVAVFIGATSGIGKSTLQHLAQHARSPHIYTVARPQTVASHETFLASLRASTNPDASYTLLPADHALISDIDAAMETVLQRETKVDILFLSAGFIAFEGRQNTVEGLDPSMSTRYYARLRAVQKLLPLLHKAARPRVVSVLAAGLEGPMPDEEDLDLRKPGNWGYWPASVQATTMGTLALEVLARENPGYPYESIQPGRHSTMRITKNITQTECGFPVEDDFAAVKIMRLVLFFTLPTFAIIIRLVVKIARISPWGFDDSTILLTYTFYIGQLLYVFTLTLIKSSILFMYLRIFPGEKFRWVLWTTQVVTVGLGMGSVFLVAFQCQPVGKAWKQWTGEESGHCIPVPPLGVVHGVVNIVLDVWMLILPASQVLFLNMKPRKKWAVMLMFSLGLFLTISSGIRLRAVLRYTTASTNPTVDAMPVAVWSDIELDVGVFTTCIPNIWQFVRRFILKDPKRVEKLSSRNAQNQNLEEYPQKSPAPASTEVGEEELR
ncbi:uncharacterized protein CCOS01_03609 [Colletotrichum costaricense]|uniref:Rhodopsin domain-containing protein n=1 Tax=Colletotrichum costaricense TaxID=1209916 RepID=A0AAI9Z5N2_9PEZI|nr:uncharacterized protein CCOS01_03609 [Colletotrichum costaricense]KAK1534857.1 hypothetical protein CCOS01_03609 [Colletotrichum costaricense]